MVYRVFVTVQIERRNLAVLLDCLANKQVYNGFALEDAQLQGDMYVVLLRFATPIDMHTLKQHIVECVGDVVDVC